MKKITCMMEVYNEEARIGDTLKILSVFDQIIVADKSSTDRTVEIAKKYGADIINFDYYDGMGGRGRWRKIFERCENEWVFAATCSDIVHPDLYKMMIEKINDGNVYDAIRIPMYRYSMGYVSKYSYWGVLQNPIMLYRHECFDLSTTQLHSDPLAKAEHVGEIKPADNRVAVYHLTHPNLELILERHIRYAKVEGEWSVEHYGKKQALKKSWHSVLRVFLNYVKLRTYKLGIAGTAQLCTLLIYRCTNYLSIYMDEDKEKEIAEKYKEIREFCAAALPREEMNEKNNYLE